MDGEDDVKKEIKCTGMSCQHKKIKDIKRSERRKTRRKRKKKREKKREIKNEKKKWGNEECMKVYTVARGKARKKG